MTVPAELNRLADIRALVREVAIEGGAPPVCLDDLVQAVDEAATNIVVHGYGDHGDYYSRYRGYYGTNAAEAAASAAVRPPLKIASRK